MLNKIYSWIKKFIKNNYKEIIFLIVFAFICFYKLPYLVYKPGGSIDLASRIEIKDKEKINGFYGMNYVKVSRGNIPTLLMSYLIKDWEIVEEQTETYLDIDYDTSFKLEQLEYKNAIFLAFYNACRIDNDCTLEVTKEEVTIISVVENADTNLKPIDKLLTMDGIEVTNFIQLRDYVYSKKEGETIKFKVIESEKEVEKYAKVYTGEDGKSKIGVSAYTTYEYTTDPEISIKTKNSEAGPSGGLMLTLAIYDYLSDMDLASGRKVMGTGTIDSYGQIGPIGGVKYKMLGAKKDKADIFFAPIENCEEANDVKKEYNIKYEVKCVATLDDAINFLTTNE